jgi:hypothetical protein
MYGRGRNLSGSFPVTFKDRSPRPKEIAVRMRRLLALSILTAALVAAPASSQASFTTGISDQIASTFSNSLYAPLSLKVARYILPYDVTSDPKELTRAQDWIFAATAAHQRILVSFEHSHLSGKERKLPSVPAYTRALKAFKSKFPKVKEWSPWNEVNRCQRNAQGTIVGQPTCHRPDLAAKYYMAARKVCVGCKIVALDVLDGPNVKPTIDFIKRFKRYAKPAPKIWGLHNYSDTNRFSSKRTKAVLKATGKGEVWLTETGGIVKFASFSYDEQRAARALGCMFTLAKSNSRIKRLYIYQFNGAPPHLDFDAGLISYQNEKRPGYDVVLRRKAGPCHK